MTEKEQKKLIDSVSSHGQTIENLEKNQKQTDLIMMGIIVVLFIGFIGVATTLVVNVGDSYRSRESSYSDLVNTINQQNIQLQRLNDKIK